MTNKEKLYLVKIAGKFRKAVQAIKKTPKPVKEWAGPVAYGVGGVTTAAAAKNKLQKIQNDKAKDSLKNFPVRLLTKDLKPAN